MAQQFVSRYIHKRAEQLCWHTPVVAVAAPGSWRQEDQDSGYHSYTVNSSTPQPPKMSSPHTNTCIHMFTASMLTNAQMPTGGNRWLSLDGWVNNCGMCIYKIMDHKKEWHCDTCRIWKGSARLKESDAEDIKSTMDQFTGVSGQWLQRAGGEGWRTECLMVQGSLLGWSYICSKKW